MKNRINKLIKLVIATWVGCLITYIIYINFGGEFDWTGCAMLTFFYLIMFLIGEIYHHIKSNKHDDHDSFEMQ